MSTVVLSAFNVTSALDIGGHFWVYMHYVLGLKSLGCDVYWLERFQPTQDPQADKQRIDRFLDEMRNFGLDRKVILYQEVEGRKGEYDYIGVSADKAEALFRHADFLLNFFYEIDPELLERFSRTAFIDIDPGLLQFWLSSGQISLAKHDVSFTIGETVGTEGAKFPDCGLDWTHIRPAVCLEQWPYVEHDDNGVFSTVSSWWGANGKGEFITDGSGLLYENNKRYSFLKFVEIPRHTRQKLELALYLGEGDSQSGGEKGGPHIGRKVGTWDREYNDIEMYQYIGDPEDRTILEHYGWHIRHSREVCGSPIAYQQYVQSSRGEFSCAKPSCMKFQNAWISDRTLCYLSSGRPVVLQNTGHSTYLPNGEGMFRFDSVEEAVDSLLQINSDYQKHRRTAREIAETFFDAKKVVSLILDSLATQKR